MLIDRFEGKRLSRPNDVVCRSDGSVYFTNPGLRIPLGERELDPSAVYRSSPTAATSTSPMSNTRTGSPSRPMSARSTSPIRGTHATSTRIELDSAGNMVRRRIFADMSSDEKIGVPDGMKVDVAGPRLLHRSGRHLGVRGGRHPYRHHQDARGAGQSVLWRTGHEDAVFHRPHFGLFSCASRWRVCRGIRSRKADQQVQFEIARG